LLSYSSVLWLAGFVAACSCLPLLGACFACCLLALALLLACCCLLALLLACLLCLLACSVACLLSRCLLALLLAWLAGASGVAGWVFAGLMDAFAASVSGCFCTYYFHWLLF